MKFVMTMFALLFSTASFANDVSNFVCTDSTNHSSLHVKFDKTHPDSVQIGTEKFLFMDENTVGDINKVWYYNSSSTVYFSFNLMNQKAPKMHVKMNTHSTKSNFISGECV